MAPIAERLPNVRTGKLRALATGGQTRLSMLPDVPTVAESGYPGYKAVGWSGIYVPNGTPQLVIDKPPRGGSARMLRVDRKMCAVLVAKLELNRGSRQKGRTTQLPAVLCLTEQIADC